MKEKITTEDIERYLAQRLGCLASAEVNCEQGDGDWFELICRQQELQLLQKFIFENGDDRKMVIDNPARGGNEN